MLPNIMAILLIALVIGGATAYIVKARKRGIKCIGCPDSCSCNSKDKDRASGCGGCGGGCHCHDENT